ncbi:hypothetical protein M378DRAFT_545048 [Amanita muscaria Koide BX008]|uniref:Crinkler effector protein N-terminal domain-containing protein n=1 Tax=Amanita muscaria (strain Koide BX008) TaxID=946122 RepID=A0A0C2WTU3_AMAMK|nr:hypothetical protein M378DRAFT_545048 [Amanita muscaria Koide BX008]
MKLNCLIEGESDVFVVPVGPEDVVSDLKKSIQSERVLGSLKDIDPHTLALWKPKNLNLIAAKPRNALVEHIGFLGDELSKFADELEAVDSVFSIFSTQPLRDYIHIIVKVPRTSE